MTPSPQIANGQFQQRTFGFGSRMNVALGCLFLIAGFFQFFYSDGNRWVAIRWWVLSMFTFQSSRALKRPFLILDDASIQMRRGITTTYQTIKKSDIQTVEIQDKKITVTPREGKALHLPRWIFLKKDWPNILSAFRAPANLVAQTIRVDRGNEQKMIIVPIDRREALPLSLNEEYVSNIDHNPFGFIRKQNTATSKWTQGEAEIETFMKPYGVFAKFKSVDEIATERWIEYLSQYLRKILSINDTRCIHLLNYHEEIIHEDQIDPSSWQERMNDNPFNLKNDSFRGACIWIGEREEVVMISEEMPGLQVSFWNASDKMINELVLFLSSPQSSKILNQNN